MTTDSLSTSVIFPYDFSHFWAAGAAAVSGENPYDRTLVFERMLTAGWPVTEGFHGFLHPPWAMWLFVPLGMLPFDVALHLWMLLNVLTSIGCYFGVRRFFKSLPLCKSATLQSLRYVCQEHSALAMFLFFSFPPLLSTLWYGQSNLVIFLGLVIFLARAQRSADLTAGAALSLILIKPQLFMGLLAALAIIVIRTGRWRILWGLVCGWGMQVVLSWLITPQIFGFFISGIQARAGDSVILPGAALSQWVYLLIPSMSVFLLVSLLSVVACVYLSYCTRANHLTHLVQVSLPLSLLGAPYVWSHSFLPLVIPYMGHLLLIQKKYERRIIYLHLSFVIFGLVEILRPHVLARFVVMLPIGIMVAYWMRGRTDARQSSSD